MAERETLEVDVLIVGGGPAGLSAAWHLLQSVKKHNERVAAQELAGPALEQPTIALVEKAEDWGNHTVSGAVMDPRGLDELMPDWRTKNFPLGGLVEEDEVLFLTENHRFKLPIVPPFMHNEGYPIVSLCKVVKWLAGQVEATGAVDMFAGFPAAEVLHENGRVAGVRTGDRGVNAKGEQKSNYEPGVDIRARVTLFAEGTRGNLVKELAEKMGLNRPGHPQMYATGIKEVWEVKPEKFRKGYVAHTMGYPLDGSTYGGGFLYHCYDNLVSLGFVVGLDYENPDQDLHADFNAFKRHPFVADMLEGGKLVQYGAKTIPEGGWYAIPQPYVDGALIAGDAAGFLNGRRLKGVHLAIKTGMLAAETILEALVRNDASAAVLSGFWNRVETSWVKEELYPARNFRQGFQGGVLVGMVRTGLQLALGGRDWADHLKAHEDHETLRTREENAGQARDNVKPDDVLTFDKLKDVYLSGTLHEEDQPSHLRVADTDICSTRCAEEYGNPCERFCPAAVYEMVPKNEQDPAAGRMLRVNFSNCVHCKTCDIKDPYAIITWVTPEGGGGPRYTIL